MKESEYILVRHLSNVLIAERALSDIVPAAQSIPIIDPREYQKVVSTLQRWREEMFEEAGKATDVG